MKLIPYTKHHITPDDEAAVLRALRSEHLTQGPEVPAFEEELAALAGAKYAVAVNSGTAALQLAYWSSGWSGFKIPAISFVATANAVAGLAKPRETRWLQFLDCEATTGLCHDVNANVVVTIGGQGVGGPARPLIVDACHGPLLHDPLADATCFSMHPAKHIAAGEGGAIVTNDEGLADECRLLRSHGRRGTEMVALGFNYRMPEMCAALARSQLTRYHEGVTARRAWASVYDKAFAGHPVIEPVPHGEDSARHLYQVLVPPDRRATVMMSLAALGIGTAIHYPVIPLQPYYRERYGFKPGDFPGAESYAARTLSLPLYPTLTATEQRHVIDSLLEVCG